MNDPTRTYYFQAINNCAEVEETDNDKENKSSTFKIIASQCYTTLILSIVFFSFGFIVDYNDYNTIYNWKSNITYIFKMPFDVIELFVVQFFFIPLGFLLGSVFAEIAGSRFLLICIIPWALYSLIIETYIANGWVIYSAYFIKKMTSSMSFVAGLTYISEMAQTKLRDIFVYYVILFYVEGESNTLRYLKFINWEMFHYIKCLTLVIGFTMLCFLPNSPHWLARKNRINEAQLSLAWFRGWTLRECVKSEFNALMNTIGITKKTVFKESCNHSSTRGKFRQFILSYTHRSFYIPLMISCALSLIVRLCEFTWIIIAAYPFERIVKRFVVPYDAELSYSFVDTLKMFIDKNIINGVTSVSCLLALVVFDKRRIALFSLLGIGTLSTAAALLDYLINKQLIDSDRFENGWQICFLLISFFLDAGIRNVLYLLVAQIMPSHCRLIGSGIVIMFHKLTGLVIINIKLNQIPSWTILTASGMVIFLGVVVVYYIIPETKGIPLNEIEEHYIGVRKFGSKKRVQVKRDANSTDINNTVVDTL